MLLQGYFDDSGSHGGEEAGCYGVLSGVYLAPSVSWPQFNAEWPDGVLKIEGPCYRLFQMSEADLLRGQFDRWPGPLRDQKVFELAEVAERWAVLASPAMVWKEDFDAHIQGGLALSSELDNPYFLLFNQIIILTAGFVQELGKTALGTSDAKVEFVFDEQGVLGRAAVGWWDVLKQTFSIALRKRSFWEPLQSSAPTSGYFPLPATDLLARSVRNVVEGRRAVC